MTDRDEIRSKLWKHRIHASNEYFDKWEKKFKCKTLEKYFEGFQWGENSDDMYSLNLFFSTFALKRPSLLFKQPIYYVEPKPSSYDSLPDEAFNWANNATDMLNTFVTSPELNYGGELEMSVIDAMSYFGIVEVGYSAHWAINPKANKPNDLVDTDEKYKEPEEIPQEEWIYVKRIPAHRFRVGGNDCAFLYNTDWCGYYDFFRIKDLQSPNSGFKNIQDIEGGTYTSTEYVTEYNENDNQLELKGDLKKCWKIWDNRSKKFFIITDCGVIIYETEFDRLPLFDLRFFKRRKGFLPIPFSFNWKSPQDEINETREQARSFRRKAKSKYQAKEQTVDEEEVQKLTAGPDGVVVWTKVENAITPIMNAPLDSSIGVLLQSSKDDFNTAAGTTAEWRGESNRSTATQSNIINQRASIRENEEREIIALWLCRIGLEILYQVMEKFTLPIWIKATSDLGGFFQDVPDIEKNWKQITTQDLGWIGYKVNVSVESLSPVANDVEKKKFLEFMAIMNQYPQLSLHPELIREAAFRVDYKNLKIIKAFQQAAILQMMGQAANGQEAGAGPQPTNMGQLTAEQMMPPDQGAMENQLNTMGVPQ